MSAAGTDGPAAGPAAAAPAGEAAACALPQDDQPVAKVIPLGIFDPFEEARKRW